jgi:pentose-5-phosphate-3-epimerase
LEEKASCPRCCPEIRRIPTICAERRLDPVIEVDDGENETAAAKTAAAVGAALSDS